MREEDLTRDRSRRSRQTTAAPIKQLNTILTAGALGAVASALWKPPIEHTVAFSPQSLFSLGGAITVLCVTVVVAPYGTLMDSSEQLALGLTVVTAGFAMYSLLLVRRMIRLERWERGQDELDRSRADGTSAR